MGTVVNGPTSPLTRGNRPESRDNEPIIEWTHIQTIISFTDCVLTSAVRALDITEATNEFASLEVSNQLIDTIERTFE